jgi:hypothetical protein
MDEIQTRQTSRSDESNGYPHDLMNGEFMVIIGTFGSSHFSMDTIACMHVKTKEWQSSSQLTDTRIANWITL